MYLPQVDFESLPLWYNKHQNYRIWPNGKENLSMESEQKTVTRDYIVSIVILYAITIYYGLVESLMSHLEEITVVLMNLAPNQVLSISAISNTSAIILIIPIGFLADRFNRTQLMSMGLIMLMISNLLFGLSRGFVLPLCAFVIERTALVVILFSTYSLLFDYVSNRSKGLALAIYFLVSPIGWLIGAEIFMNNILEVWRTVFISIGIVGGVFLIMSRFLKNPGRIQDNIPSIYNGLVKKDEGIIKILLRPSILLLVIASFTFAFGNIGTWMFKYIQMYKDLSISSMVGFYQIALVTIGTILSGLLSDYFVAKKDTNHSIIIVGVVGAFIGTFIFLYTKSAAMTSFGFVLHHFFTGITQIPFIVLILTLVQSKYRMALYGIYTFVKKFHEVNALLIGFFSEKFNLAFALKLVSLFMVASAIIYVLSWLSLSKQLEAAEK